MILLSLGLNHTTAPVEIRERLAFSAEKARQALCSLPREASQGVILSTCNRSEVYAVAAAPEQGEEALKQFLSQQHNLPLSFFSDYLCLFQEQEAMRHLFRVVSGIDSMVLGEDQIQGQVRRALQIALAAGSAGRHLSRLFRHALEVGKRVRRETLISRHTVSVSHASVLLARQLFPQLKECHFLIISAGETGKLTGKIVRESGARRITVTNRTYRKAAELARRLGGEAVAFSCLPQALAEADIVISSTGAPGYVFTPPLVEAALNHRRRPLALIDIAVPRDVDPQVKQIENVFLYNIDDLQAIAEEGMDERRKEADQVEAIVEEEVARAMKWWRAQEVVPTIVALRKRAESIREQELAEALNKLPHLADPDREKVEALSRAIVNKLLHYPIVRLKDGGSQNLRAARELFRLPQED